MKILEDFVLLEVKVIFTIVSERFAFSSRENIMFAAKNLLHSHAILDYCNFIFV